MKKLDFAKKTTCALAGCLLAAGIAAAPALADEMGRHSPWFGGGLKPIPFGREPEYRERGALREAPFVRYLYRGFLGREPSNDEVRYWIRELSRDVGATEMVRSFMESDEFFIRQTYLGLLHREPDPSGMETFSRALDRGATRADVVESILRSQELHRLLR